MAWNSGSIGSIALNIIDGVPSSISGTIPVFVEKATEKIQNYTGDSVSSSNFDAKYMPTVLNFVLADVCRAMSIQGADSSSLKLGDFSTGKGTDSNVSSEAKKYDELANECMGDLGRKSSVSKAFG